MQTVHIITTSTSYFIFNMADNFMDIKRRKILLSIKGNSPPPLPWAIDKQNFYDICNRCNKCLKECKNQIISTDKYGYPYVDFTQGSGECDFCHHCVDICELPLFNKIETPPWQHTIQINSACLSLQNIECRSCSDICNYQVINFTPTSKGFQININKDKCTGCGACLSLCPVNAIQLRDKE